ncbi:MAG: hypothetical protein K2H09_01940, partial [Treponemataceae bacterium]|nr:hypothetical protein [Treponemataceae bacterium]
PPARRPSLVASELGIRDSSFAKASAAYGMIRFILGKKNTYQDAENEQYESILDDSYDFDDDD